MLTLLLLLVRESLSAQQRAVALLMFLILLLVLLLFLLLLLRVVMAKVQQHSHSQGRRHRPALVGQCRAWVGEGALSCWPVVHLEFLICQQLQHHQEVCHSMPAMMS